MPSVRGPIVGPVNGLQSVLINKHAGGDATVTVIFIWRDRGISGETPQAPLEGFEASGAKTVLGGSETR